MEPIEFSYRKPIHKKIPKPSMVVFYNNLIVDLFENYIHNVHNYIMRRRYLNFDFPVNEELMKSVERGITTNVNVFRDRIYKENMKKGKSFKWNSNYELAKALSIKIRIDALNGRTT